MEQKHTYLRKEFIRLSPGERIALMDRLFRETLKFRAVVKGVSEFEIYIGSHRRDNKTP